MGRIKEFYHDEIVENYFDDIEYQEQEQNKLEELYTNHYPKWMKKFYK